MTVRDIMTPEPACCTQDTSIQQAAKMMADLNIGSIPVVSDMNSRHVVGMITDRDICIRAVATCMDCNSTLVGQLMSTDVSSCPQDSNLEECLKTMESRQIRRMPIVNNQGSLVGIVAQADVALAAGDSKTGDLVEKVSRPFMS